MIGIVDTRAGNLTSVRAALNRLGVDHVTLEAPRLEGIHTLLVPGQGRFAAVMETLDARGWREPLLEWHAEDRPLLGICVGQQILFETSDEDPGARGLGILPGHVEKLAFPKSPMVGWAPVAWTPEASGERDLASGDAYFVNSYAARESDAAIATTTYGETFVSAVRKGNTVAVQFHPEKSGTWGQAVLGQLLAR
ncbi:imidazole glycerol phosphate synthase subunit HisH [Rubricoccus marinus]|uniref:Imidazole glycerol phosphate synthase subunit HisH n=1 Tax=Rubricoccus marinus TaxID=716817 RepID=A0A259TX92_9BACT|nr:imidazole glycerol phosphate synthase subunit HisH [Rubricoccus marinus]OZC02316.1 imidazole glycerol phosphate synthase subunit HisH [Rubricoccus marinus]